MPDCCLALCQTCGAVWLICSTGYHEEWRVRPLVPEVIFRMAPMPPTPKQILNAVVSGELKVDWAAVEERKSFVEAASEPFCPDDGTPFTETYAHNVTRN